MINEKLKEIVKYDYVMDIVKTKKKLIEKEFLYTKKFYLTKETYLYVHFYKLVPNEIYPSKLVLVFKMGKNSFRMIFDTFDEIKRFIVDLGLYLVDVYTTYEARKDKKNSVDTRTSLEE